jgi:hypothetical protein
MQLSGIGVGLDFTTIALFISGLTHLNEKSRVSGNQQDVNPSGIRDRQ